MFVTPMPSDNSLPSSPESGPCAGLSALIHAATSQLEHLAEVASTQFVVEEAPRKFDDKIDDEETMTLPVQLMKLCCQQPENENIITFLPNGKFFAIRQSLFQERYLDTLLRPEGGGDTVRFTDFVSHLQQQWGFRRLDAPQNERGDEKLPEVLVFRHAQFTEGDYATCRQMVRVVPPEDRRAPATTHHSAVTKRRLSPGFLQEESAAHQNGHGGCKVQVVHLEEEDGGCHGTCEEEATTMASPCCERKISSASETTGEGSCCVAVAPEEEEEADQEQHLRTVASSIAHDKMQLSAPPTQSSSSSLVDTAVTACTYEIVTGAICSLLRDPRHSQDVYAQHAAALSRSSLPGLVPVCAHLFSSTPPATLPTTQTTSVVRVVTVGSEESRTTPPILGPETEVPPPKEEV